MKTSKLLTMLALPLAFAACTNDEFIANVETPATGEVLSIGEDFALMVARDADEASTRANYHIVTEEDGSKLMRFFWEPKIKASGSSLDDITSFDKIGLGWLNVKSAQDGKIYTNYEFAHKGWPLHNKTAQYQCDKWIDAYGLEANLADHTASVQNGAINSPKDYARNNGVADLHRGLFMTENKSIMGGDYIVYYPYDETIIENGYVKATSKREFTGFVAAGNNAYDDYLAGLADETFYISSEPVTLTGGVTANEFRMQAVSGVIRVKLNLDEVSSTTSKFDNITKIALYSEEGFITEVQLDASKIGSATGEGLYVGTAKKVNTLVAEYTTPEGGKPGLTGDVLNFCIPALPTTAKNVKVIIYRNNDANFDGSVVIATGQDLTVKPGQITNLTLTLNDYAAPVDGQIAVVDEASLRSAIDKANDGTTIYLLDDIKLADRLVLPNKVLTLTGGDIIIPARKSSNAIELRLGTTSATSKKITVNSNIIVEERGCCNQKAGLLTVLNNVTLNGAVENKGQVVFGDGTNSVKGIELNGEINNLTTEFLDEEQPETYATITVKAKTEANINNAMNIGKDTKLVVKAQDGTSTSGDDGTLYIANGKSLTNNGDILVDGNITNNNGAFVNNSIVTETVGAQITGSQITEQADDAQYICEVNSVNRFNDAVNINSHSFVTMVRFKDGAYKYTLEGDYKNINGDWINFESDLSTNQLLTLEHKQIGSVVVASHIGELSIKNGGLVISHEDLTMEYFTVDHQNQTSRGMNINQKIKVAYDVNIKKYDTSVTANINFIKGIQVDGNMTVTDTGDNSVAFAKECESDIAGNMTVEKDGKMEFLAMSITNIKGANGFANDGKVTIVTTTSGNEFPARVYSRSYTNGGDKTKWINGSEPIIKDWKE